MKNFKYKDKEYSLKTSWDDVNLEEYNKLKKETTVVGQLAILTNMNKVDLRDMHSSILESITKQLDYFWNEDIKSYDEIFITIDGEKIFVDLNDMSLGQWVDCEELIKQGVEENLHTIIAILCKPITLKYSEYNWDIVAKKILKCSIREVMNIVDFFFYIQSLLERTIQASTTIESMNQ